MMFSGVAHSHLEGTMDDYPYMMLRCFRAGHGRCGLREQPLSLVVTSTSHVCGLVLGCWWWRHCLYVLVVFDSV
jgi:hypothetical protein